MRQTSDEKTLTYFFFRRRTMKRKRNATHAPYYYEYQGESEDNDRWTIKNTGCIYLKVKKNLYIEKSISELCITYHWQRCQYSIYLISQMIGTICACLKQPEISKINWIFFFVIKRHKYTLHCYRMRKCYRNLIENSNRIKKK